MKASEFVKKLKDIVDDYKTLYVMGCFGAPMTTANKKRYSNNHSYNMQSSRLAHIAAATTDTFGFDCVCLIKGVLWGWCGDKAKTYGGAKYKANGVPDIGADAMIKECSDVSDDFEHIQVGEAVWTTGHIGVYIGNGLVVEASPAWKNCVQITACNVTKTGYPTRKWKKHGKFPYIEYDVVEEPKKVEYKVDAALKKNAALAGAYQVTASALNLRVGANTNKKSIMVLKRGDVVRNYGFFNVASNGIKWLLVKAPDGTVGYCSSTYLKKV